MGDRVAEPIFLALGKAVSAWEGVQAATSSLYLSMRTQKLEDDDPGFEAFGGMSLVHKRRKQLMERGEEFLSADFGAYREKAEKFKNSLESLMAEYVGWAEMRNDIAHGYVTEAHTPDYYDPSQNIVVVYSLCPSHARLPKWPHGEPLYNYVASELEEFARCFQDLDARMEALADIAQCLSPKGKQRRDGAT